MSQPFFDLTGTFIAQKNHLIDLKNRNVQDTNVSDNLNKMSRNLDSVYYNIQGASAVSTAVLNNQTDMKEIVNTELKRLNTKKRKVDSAIQGQNRMIELNNSYREKTAYYIRTMIIIVIILIIYIIINLSKQRFDFIPEFVFDILQFILGIIAVYIIYSSFVNVMSRDNMDFSKLNFEPPKMPSTPEEIKKQQQNSLQQGDLLGSISTAGCVGDKCCSNGTTWNPGNSVCIRSGFTTMSNSQIGSTSSNNASEVGKYSFIQ
jgi:uncharacterized integral membrane protein